MRSRPSRLLRSDPTGSRAAACRARTRWAPTRPSSNSGCASSPTSRCSARSGTLAGRRRRSTSSCATNAARCRARCGAPTSRSSKLDREALADGAQIVVGGGTDYYEGSPHLLALVHLPGPRPARGRRGRPAGPAGAAAQAAGRRGAVRPPEAAGAAGAAAHHRRGHRPDRQGPRRRAGRAGAAGLAGTGRLGLRARAGPARRPGHHAGAPGPGRHRRGGHDRGGARRRLAGRHVRLLRRDAVPHRGAAVRAGDLVRGPPHRPHADRRRVRRVLLHPHPRGRAGGTDPLQRGPHPAGPLGARLRDAGRRTVVHRARRWPS